MEFSNGFNSKSLFEYAAEKTGVEPAQIEQLLADYMDMQVLYRSAIREASSRLEVLDDEFQYRHKRNPIHTIQTRLKTPQSMMEKLGRRNLAPRAEVIREELTDIAGIRVICSYVDDIYHIATLLYAQEDIELVRVRDYIETPKESGYRSLHIVMKVPVNFSNGRHMVPVEIQIRTIAMDFWASLEHELRYKSAASATEDIMRELRECADSIATLDCRMQAIYHRLDQMEDAGKKAAPKKAK